MDTNKATGANWEVQQAKQGVRLGAWSIASGATWVFAVLGHQFLWDGNRTIFALAIAVNVIVGLVLLRANRDYLRSLDEMQQRVYLESMGLAFAIGLEAGLLYFALAITNVITMRADIAMALMMALMYLTHLGGIFYGNFWKFR
jgi:hypothetical protein